MFDKLLTRTNVNLTVSQLYAAGILVDLNKKFYEAFEGKYYQGLPVNYVLHEGLVGWDIHASEALTLALGKDATWCAGSLEAFLSYDAPESATRHWVEVRDSSKTGYVLEPTWGMAIDKDLYYKIFGVKVTERQKYAAFIKARQKNPAAVNLYRREDYEERGVPLNPNVVKYAQDWADIALQSSQDPKKRLAAKILLATLPDLTKCQNLIEPRVKRLTTMQRFGKFPRKAYGDLINSINPDADWVRD